MRFDILTLFPDMFDAYLREGVLARGIKRELITVNLINIRDFARGAHRTTDDRPYGGGDGMVMKPGPIYRALESVHTVGGKRKVVLLSPQGEPFHQRVAWEMSHWDQLVLISGRYEGIDDRIRRFCADMELSIGDYVLSGGELAAMVVVDTVCRLIPGVLGGERSNLEDSFQDNLLEYPHYTRPRVFHGAAVPEILLSGDHEKIRLWRREQALKRTQSMRPDLFEGAELTDEDEQLLTGA